MTLGSGRVQISFAEEEWDVVDLAGSTVGASGITVLTGLSVSKYAGQVMRSVGPGTSRGREWHVQDNDAVSITTEEATVATAPALANTDDVAIETGGKAVTTANITAWIGEFDNDQMLPDPKFSILRPHAHGVGQDPADQITQKVQYHAPLKFIVQDWKFLFLALGREHTTGADKAAGGGSDVDETNGTGIGNTHLDVTDATNYAALDYIQIGTGITAEVRKITAVATNALTLEHGMRFNHADTELCNEVEAPFTHTLRLADRLPTFSLSAVYDEATDENRVYHGGKVNRLTLKSTVEGLVEAEMDCWFQNCTPDNTKPSVTIDTTDPYHYRMTDGGISINGVTYARIESFEFTVTRNLKEKYYHCDLSGNKPFEHIEGKRLVDLKITIVPTNMDIWDLLNAGTEFTVIINIDRTATSDEFTLTFKNCRLPEGNHGLPEDGEVKVNLAISTHISGANLPIEVSVIDDNPHFGFN